jgi:hypothetical protein
MIAQEGPEWKKAIQFLHRWVWDGVTPPEVRQAFEAVA